MSHSCSETWLRSGGTKRSNERQNEPSYAWICGPREFIDLESCQPSRVLKSNHGVALKSHILFKSWSEATTCEQVILSVRRGGEGRGTRKWLWVFQRTQGGKWADHTYTLLFVYNGLLKRPTERTARLGLPPALPMASLTMREGHREGFGPFSSPLWLD